MSVNVPRELCHIKIKAKICIEKSFMSDHSDNGYIMKGAPCHGQTICQNSSSC